MRSLYNFPCSRTSDIAPTDICDGKLHLCSSGTQFDESAESPSSCPICEDERQFIRHSGQQWTTLERPATDHRNRLEEEAPRLLGIGTEFEFAIGQRALLLQSPDGNLLWDCIAPLGDRTIAEINARGGIRAIAISHPHYYLGFPVVTYENRVLFCTKTGHSELFFRTRPPKFTIVQVFG